MIKGSGRLSDNKIIMLANDYVDSDLTVGEIANKYGICKVSVNKLLRKLGIETKNRKKEDWERLAKRFWSSREEVL